MAHARARERDGVERQITDFAIDGVFIGVELRSSV